MEAIKGVFIRHLLANYQNYCMQTRMIPDMTSFLDYLMNHNLISATSIRHYVLLEEYNRWQQSHKYKNKTEVVQALALAYHLHETSVWNILKDHKEKFSYVENGVEG